MAPNKDWMDLVDDRLNEEYDKDVQSFLSFAFKRTGENNEIRCSCVKCNNTYSGTREIVETHLKVYGIVRSYTFWYHHGERLGEPQSESDDEDSEEAEEDESDNEVENIIRDLYPDFSDLGMNHESANVSSHEVHEEEPNDEAKKVFSRHLGKIVHDRNICPLQVHSWKEIEEDNKNHMWAAVTDKFQNKEIEAYRDETLEHMNELWNKWREDLHRKFIKPCKTIQDALKNFPEGVDRDDWKWLVTEHFFSEKFLAASKRNSENRTKGGKDNNPPSLATIFYETRKKGGQLKGEETIKKYDEIIEASQSNPSFSNIELFEKCFGSQNRNHVICFGGGVKPNDLRPYSSRADLHTKLCETQKENESLKNRIDGMEAELRAIKEMLQQ